MSYPDLVFSVFLLFVSSATIAQKSDIEDENLKGKVKSVKQYTVVATDSTGTLELGDTVSSWGYYFKSFYNEDGLRVKKHELNPDGSIFSISVTKYKDGRIAYTSYTVPQDSAHYFAEYSFNKKENKLFSQSYSGENERSKHYIYTLDDEDRTVDALWYNPDSTLNTHFIYIHSGDTLTTQYALRDGDSTLRYIYRYNDNGDRIQYKAYDFNRFWKVIDYEYNENNDLLKSTEYYFDDPPEIRTYKYKYDNYGNWLVRLEWIDGELKYAAIRDLTYYK